MQTAQNVIHSLSPTVPSLSHVGVEAAFDGPCELLETGVYNGRAKRSPTEKWSGLLWLDVVSWNSIGLDFMDCHGNSMGLVWDLKGNEWKLNGIEPSTTVDVLMAINHSDFASRILLQGRATSMGSPGSHNGGTLIHVSTI